MAYQKIERGKLLLGRYQLNQTVDVKEADPAYWRIALMHHPWDYLAEGDGREARDTVHRCSDLLLRGHLHEPETQQIVPPDPERGCLELATGCAYEQSGYPNAFQWVELYPVPRKVRVHYRLWERRKWMPDRNRVESGRAWAEFSLSHAGDGPGPASGVVPEARGAPSPNHTLDAGPSMQASGAAGFPASPERTGAYQPVVAPAGPPTAGGDGGRCDVLLLYVNEIERDAITGTFCDSDGRPPAPTSVEGLPLLNIGLVGSKRVFALGTNMGSATSGGTASVVTDAIATLHPKWIVAVGIAFGMDAGKTPLGTILVSDQVSCYEPQRRGRGAWPWSRGEMIKRGDKVPVDPYLKKTFEQISGFPYWQGARVRFGELLSGEKLIDDPKFKAALRDQYPEAIGGEMEAAGIKSAAMLKQTPWLVVKAVCDFADGHKGDDKKAHQTKAAGNAAAFVHHVLSTCRGDDGIDPLPGDGRSIPVRDVDPVESSGQRMAGLRSEAIAAVRVILDTQSLLCETLAGRAPVSGDSPEDIAAWLLRPGAAALRDGLWELEQMVPSLSERLPRSGSDPREVYRKTRDIMGWMVVTAVREDFCHEQAPAVRGWLQHASFDFPLGSREGVETLLACWRGGHLQCRLRADDSHKRVGEDDITPRGVVQQFDSPELTETDRLVDSVWKMVYQRIEGNEAPSSLSQMEKSRLESRMTNMAERQSRHLHLLIDRRDLGQGFASPTAIKAIRLALPLVRLIFIDSDRGSDGHIFLLPEAELADAISALLKAIEDHS
jgi:nucleoside phosphorylase